MSSSRAVADSLVADSLVGSFVPASGAGVPSVAVGDTVTIRATLFTAAGAGVASNARFSLLTGAVSLLVFLVLLLSTLSAALVGALVGALEGLRADGLVYADFARDNIAASRMDPQVALAVSLVEGVTAAAPLSTFTTAAVT